MPKERLLTKRNYVGVGYNHRFTNDTTGEIVYVPCTQEEYEALGLPGGAKNNPTLDGHTWVCSEGGTCKVDTPTGVLGENEYVEFEGKVVARFAGIEDAGEQFKVLPLVAVTSDKIDEAVWL
jgi:hypothetical protein